jgi:hypothetical protein
MSLTLPGSKVSVSVTYLRNVLALDLEGGEEVSGGLQSRFETSPIAIPSCSPEREAERAERLLRSAEEAMGGRGQATFASLAHRMRRSPPQHAGSLGSTPSPPSTGTSSPLSLRGSAQLPRIRQAIEDASRLSLSPQLPAPSGLSRSRVLTLGEPGGVEGESPMGLLVAAPTFSGGVGAGRFTVEDAVAELERHAAAMRL